MVNDPLPAFWANTASLPVLAMGVLAIIGWLLAGRVKGSSPLLRMIAAATLLVAMGAVAGLAIYLLNGLSVLPALRDDPGGALVWFAWVGAQLAGGGIAITWARMLLGRKGAT